MRYQSRESGSQNRAPGALPKSWLSKLREAKTSWGETSITADIDTLWADYHDSAGGRTYGTVSAYYVGATYRDMAIEGLPAW